MATALTILATLLRVGGSLGLFLYGMRVMSDGIQKTAGERLHSILNIMTGNRVVAVFSGFLITVLVQSSSASTVMIVSFVHAGLLTLVQSVGMILGANIGTTVTGWIVAILGFRFNVSAAALPAIAIGALFVFTKKFKKTSQGEALLGFGVLFLGLGFLRESVPDIQQHPEILEFLARFTDAGLATDLLFIIVGGLLTIVVQSSSAAMAITLTMAFAGWIDYRTAAAIILGENIGTTVTAFLASLTASVDARRASRAHTLFNVIGVLWMIPLFGPALRLVDALLPGSILTGSAMILLPARLALFHTLFNIVNTALFLPFLRPFVKLVERLVPETGPRAEGKYTMRYISSVIQDTPELYLIAVREELSRMAQIVAEMYGDFLSLLTDNNADVEPAVEQQHRKEDYTDQMQQELSEFLARASTESISAAAAAEIGAMLRVTDELESIADACFNLSVLVRRQRTKDTTFSPKATDRLIEYAKIVHEVLMFIHRHLELRLGEVELEEAKVTERRINAQRDKLKKAARKRMQKNPKDVKGELIYIDMVSQIERIGDYALATARALRSMRVSNNRNKPPRGVHRQGATGHGTATDGKTTSPK